MTEPVLVEVTRGPVVESHHRGAIAVVDGDGRLVAALGDIDRPSFPRSAVKPFQALPLIESGAADRFGFGEAELALAMASHNGEARHLAVARSMLARAGLDEGCLECGPHWPNRMDDQAALHRAGLEPEVDFLTLSSYKKSKTSSGRVEILRDPSRAIPPPGTIMCTCG